MCWPLPINWRVASIGAMLLKKYLGGQGTPRVPAPQQGILWLLNAGQFVPSAASSSLEQTLDSAFWRMEDVLYNMDCLVLSKRSDQSG
jgi:hypothetical protein